MARAASPVRGLRQYTATPAPCATGPASIDVGVCGRRGGSRTRVARLMRPGAPQESAAKLSGSGPLAEDDASRCTAYRRVPRTATGPLYNKELVKKNRGTFPAGNPMGHRPGAMNSAYPGPQDAHRNARRSIPIRSLSHFVRTRRNRPELPLRTPHELLEPFYRLRDRLTFRLP